MYEIVENISATYPARFSKFPYAFVCINIIGSIQGVSKYINKFVRLIVKTIRDSKNLD